jgi:hypothetical protein
MTRYRHSCCPGQLSQEAIQASCEPASYLHTLLRRTEFLAVTCSSVIVKIWPMYVEPENRSGMLATTRPFGPTTDRGMGDGPTRQDGPRRDQSKARLTGL